MIDAFNLLSNFDTSEFLSDRYGNKEIIPEDERTISDLMVDQVEFADVLILNKIDTVDEATREKIRKLLKMLNPDAKVLESSYARIDVKEIIGTGRFDFIKAASGAGWLRSLHEMTMRETAVGQRMAPKPETLEYGLFLFSFFFFFFPMWMMMIVMILIPYRYGINNFVYTARKPFHPRRLFALLHDKFIVLQNREDEEEGQDDDEGGEDNDDEMTIDEKEEDSEDEDEGDEMEIEDFEQPDPAVILANKRAHPAFNPILRSKGFFWLATRPFQFGEWSQAGGMLTVGCGGPWFAEVPEEAWPEDKDIQESIRKDFSGPWGDRRQELVFIGMGIEPDLITKLLDSCLLDDEDMAKWEKVMKSRRLSMEKKATKLSKMWEDGWEEWPPFEIEEEDEDAEEEQTKPEDGRPKRKISEHLGNEKKKHVHVHAHDHSSHSHHHHHLGKDVRHTKSVAV